MSVSSDRDTSGSLGEREMTREHELAQPSVFTTFSNSAKLSRVFIERFFF